MHLSAADLPEATPDGGAFPVRRVPDGMMLTRDWAGQRVLVPATTRGKPNTPWDNGSCVQDVNTGRVLPVTTVDQSIVWIS